MLTQSCLWLEDPFVIKHETHNTVVPQMRFYISHCFKLCVLYMKCFLKPFEQHAIGSFVERITSLQDVLIACFSDYRDGGLHNLSGSPGVMHALDCH